MRVRSGAEAELARRDGIARQQEAVVAGSEADIAGQLAVRDVERVAAGAEPDVADDRPARRSPTRQRSA